MMEQQKVIIASDLQGELAAAMAECHADRTFVLVDETTERLCLPVVAGFGCMQGVQKIVIAAGDTSKTLESLAHVWSELQRMGATRHSLLVNLGGGMVTDLGGFAAATFKRGISCINIPTTLLAMVDASVGGKTGINFGGLKNEVGVFRNASSVIIDTVFLQTMDHENLLSGYAEMLKHGLINLPASPSVARESMLGQLLSFDLEQPDLVELQRMVADSVAVKQRIVLEDPTEQGLRKALNLGHTIGHAFESLALGAHPSALTSPHSPLTSHLSPLISPHSPLTSQHSPVLHGYAVAWGLVCELYLSVVKTGFPAGTMRQVVNFIVGHYGRMPITCDDYPVLLELMTHDKKNVAGEINFSLLSDVGRLCLNQTATKKEIEEALDFYREGQ